MSETKHTEAVLTVLHPPWGIPFSPVLCGSDGNRTRSETLMAL